MYLSFNLIKKIYKPYFPIYPNWNFWHFLNFHWEFKNYTTVDRNENFQYFYEYFPIFFENLISISVLWDISSMVLSSWNYELLVDCVVIFCFIIIFFCKFCFSLYFICSTLNLGMVYGNAKLMLLSCIAR